MKIFVVTLIVLLGFALSDAERYCDEVKKNLAENAVCPTDNSPHVQCKDYCSGELKTNEEDCEQSNECCWIADKCHLKSLPQTRSKRSATWFLPPRPTYIPTWPRPTVWQPLPTPWDPWTRPTPTFPRRRWG